MSHHHHHHISAGEALIVFSLLELEKRAKAKPPKPPTPAQLGLLAKTPAQIHQEIARIDAHAAAIRAERLAREAGPMPLRQKVFLFVVFTIGALVVLASVVHL